MNFGNSGTLSLAKTLLLADPSLNDPNFRRTVLYLSGHCLEKGAEGFVLNRPLKRRVGDLGLSFEQASLRELPVYAGGPVATDKLIFASLHWAVTKGTFEFSAQLSPQEAAARVEEGFIVRAFVGYSGWAAGQLEEELKERVWITHQPDDRFLEADGQHMWTQTLERKSPWHYLLSKTPEDPSLN